MAKYWFARRQLDKSYNRKMGPVSREGWLVVGFFVGCMVVGGIAMFCFAMVENYVLGVGSFVVLAIVGMTTFITLAYRRGDMNHTVEDYRTGRVTQ